MPALQHSNNRYVLKNLSNVAKFDSVISNFRGRSKRMGIFWQNLWKSRICRKSNREYLFLAFQKYLEICDGNEEVNKRESGS